MKIRKIIIRSVLIILGIILGIVVFLIAGAIISSKNTSTPPFRDSTGKIIEGSIALIEEIELGGYKQTVLIRGRDVKNPMLLYLHGGPGSSELPLVRHFNSALENHYTVVLWDQRGAGKSFSLFLDSRTMTIDQFLSDTHQLVNILRNRFNKDKIYLVGHSWGSVLGLSTAYNYPELFYAYIGIGQAIDFVEGEKLSLHYAITRAKELNNTEALSQLEALKDYPAVNEHWLNDVFTQRKWLGEFGGVMYGAKGMQSLFFIERPPEFSFFEFIPLAVGSITSLKTLWPQIINYGDFRKLAPELKVPVYFVTGRHDYNVPFALTEDYFRKVNARKKALVWFEKSAHMANFEEPEKFNDFMINIVLPETYHK
jgi:pimeloyl-ACP methyl ester carboxylesterase